MELLVLWNQLCRCQMRFAGQCSAAAVGGEAEALRMRLWQAWCTERVKCPPPITVHRCSHFCLSLVTIHVTDIAYLCRNIRRTQANCVTSSIAKYHSGKRQESAETPKICYRLLLLQVNYKLWLSVCPLREQRAVWLTMSLRSACCPTSPPLGLANQLSGLRVAGKPMCPSVYHFTILTRTFRRSSLGGALGQAAYDRRRC